MPGGVVLQGPAMSEEVAVLFANDAFYTTFAGRDMEAMREVWSDKANIRCIHPGWDEIDGRESVLDSLAAILGGDAAPDITCHHAKAVIYGDVAVVVCHEEVEDAFLIATNIFERHGRIWKMVHHQAGPMGVQPRPADAEAKDPVQ